VGNEKGDGAYATAAMLFPRLRRLSRAVVTNIDLSAPVLD